MEANTTDKIVKIFKERILTPVLYMVENEDFVELVCFCDRSMDIETIYDTSRVLEKETGIQFEIADIREYCEEDRLEIITNATLLYSEDKLIEVLFQKSMIEDYGKLVKKREEMLIRYRDNTSPYIQ